MKYFPSILAGIILALFTGALIASAAETSYTPLAPLPIGEGGTTPTAYTMSTYLSGMIKLLIALGAALAVLYAVIGGTQYIAASINPVAKKDARERIERALLGLGIILTSYLILNSINPKLVEFNFMLPPVGVPPGAAVAPTWGDDSAVRSVLADKTSITVNKANCTVADKDAAGGSDCTSVYGLNGNAISGLRTLYANCRPASLDGSCNITITGGTEYWLHKSHDDGRKVDLAMGATRGLDYYIKKGGTVPIQNCGVKDDPHYQPDGPSGGIYVDEPNRDSNGNITGTGRHWHVCY